MYPHQPPRHRPNNIPIYQASASSPHHSQGNQPGPGLTLAPGIRRINPRCVHPSSSTTHIVAQTPNPPSRLPRALFGQRHQP
ncbi:hypothetical protein AB6846_25560 [Serratia proteamaculans]